jgi:hypothetical protein
MRTTAKVRPAAIARHMGVTRQRIRQIENSIDVPGAAAERYERAIEELRRVG